MNIIIDIDGCICNYDFPTLIKKYFGVEVPNKAVLFYSLEDCLGLPPSAVTEMFREEVHAPPNFVPGAIKVMTDLLDDGHNISLFTNRIMFTSTYELENWLDKYEIPYTNIVLPESLPSYAHAMIDDSPRKLLMADQITRIKHLLLFDNPWNRKCLDVLHKFERVKTWGRVKRAIYEY